MVATIRSTSLGRGHPLTRPRRLPSSYGRGGDHLGMADKAPVMDLRDAEPVAIRETPNARGARRSRVLRNRLGEELSSARRRVEAGHEMVARVERGDPTAMSIDLAARIAEVVGLHLSASLHPNGDAVRDRAHLALIARFRARLSPDLRWRTEVPIPIAGDQRSGDGVITGEFGDAPRIRPATRDIGFPPSSSPRPRSLRATIVRREPRGTIRPCRIGRSRS